MKQFLSGRLVRPMVVAAALVGASAPAAFADLSDVVFSVSATSGSAVGSFQVLQSQGSWNGDIFTWSLTTPVTLTGSGGEEIATIAGGSVQYIADPVINMTFEVQNVTNAPLLVQINSGLLSFGAINPAQAAAAAAITVTDFSGDNDGGAFAQGVNGNSGTKAYQANLNGLIPGGTQFAELVDSVFEPVEGGSEDGNEGTGGLINVGGPITSMSAEFELIVSPLDAVSGTSSFVVIPEPASFALLAFGGLLIARRRR